MKTITKCRVCGSDRLIEYLDLGLMPLSNNLARTEAQALTVRRYPLRVLFCQDCMLSQLSVVIDPYLLFDNYVYRSSISETYKRHCYQMAGELMDFMSQPLFPKLPGGIQHIDIAGNDGALINEFAHALWKYNYSALNVDPAKNLREPNAVAGIPMYNEYWNSKTAKKILNGGLLKPGASKSNDEPVDSRADIITATNVFAHIDDVTDFLWACKIILKPSGIIVLEFPYLIDFIENREFDTVYFEHLSYFSIYPLMLLAQQVGFNIMNVTKQDIHGGSVRVIIGYGITDDTVVEFVKHERCNYSNIDPYYQFAVDVGNTIAQFRRAVNTLGGRVAAFGASAKGNILLNAADIHSNQIEYIVDETPEKIGMYSPGTGIPIVPMEALGHPYDMPDHLVVLSWNFKDEIIRKCIQAGYKGDFIIPIPEFKTIPNTAAIYYA